jgi:hypothetical protein
MHLRCISFCAPYIQRRRDVTNTAFSFFVYVTATRTTNQSPCLMTRTMNQASLSCVLICKKLFAWNVLRATGFFFVQPA